MRKYRKYSVEEKMISINRILNQGISCNEEARRIDVSTSVLFRWIYKYQNGGIEKLYRTKNNTKYSEKTKLKAVHDVLVKGQSKLVVAKKYNISSTSVLYDWISKYTNNEKVRITRKGSSKIMTKHQKKTTLKERIEIAQYTIANELDYHKAMEKYNVSYQQVYTWVRKYQKNGDQGLVDRRGRGKYIDESLELTEIERYQLRIKELEERNKYLEMARVLEKKLEDIAKRFEG